MDELQYLTDEKRHLICLPYSIDNLHQMAKELDIHPCWFHKDHYDIPKKRIDEITSKCMIVNSRTIVEVTKDSNKIIILSNLKSLIGLRV